MKIFFDASVLNQIQFYSMENSRSVQTSFILPFTSSNSRKIQVKKLKVFIVGSEKPVASKKSYVI